MNRNNKLVYFDCPKCGWKQPDDPNKKQKRCPICRTRTSRGRGKGAHSRESAIRTSS